MVALEVVADASGEANLPGPGFAVLVERAGMPASNYGIALQGELTLDLKLVTGHVYPLRWEGGRSKLTGLTPAATYRVAVASSEWEASVLR